jgi:hypothetical protein
MPLMCGARIHHPARWNNRGNVPWPPGLRRESLWRERPAGSPSKLDEGCGEAPFVDLDLRLFSTHSLRSCVPTLPFFDPAAASAPWRDSVVHPLQRRHSGPLHRGDLHRASIHGPAGEAADQPGGSGAGSPRRTGAGRTAGSRLPLVERGPGLLLRCPAPGSLVTICSPHHRHDNLRG